MKLIYLLIVRVFPFVLRLKKFTVLVLSIRITLSFDIGSFGKLNVGSNFSSYSLHVFKTIH